MAFSGIIDRNSPITLARLLELIYDTDEPGQLILQHNDTKEQAVLVINRGEIVGSQCGELSGEAAMRRVSTSFPWSYHFVGRHSAAKSDEETQLPMPRPAKRPALKLKPLLASEETSAFNSAAPARVPTTDAPIAPVGETPPASPVRRPVMLARKAPEPATEQVVMPAPAVTPDSSAPEAASASPTLDRPLLKLIGEPLPGASVPEDFVEQAQVPPTAPKFGRAKARRAISEEGLAAWLAGGDDHFIRFAESGGEWRGSIDSADWEYFRADYNWLAAMGNAVGQSLGFSPALTMAVAEPQRAAGYGTLEDGFVGILGGKGAGVVQVLQFDESLPS